MTQCQNKVRCELPKFIEVQETVPIMQAVQSKEAQTIKQVVKFRDGCGKVCHQIVEKSFFPEVLQQVGTTVSTKLVPVECMDPVESCEFLRSTDQYRNDPTACLNMCTCCPEDEEPRIECGWVPTQFGPIWQCKERDVGKCSNIDRKCGSDKCCGKTTCGEHGRRLCDDDVFNPFINPYVNPYYGDRIDRRFQRQQPQPQQMQQQRPQQFQQPQQMQQQRPQQMQQQRPMMQQQKPCVNCGGPKKMVN